MWKKIVWSFIILIIAIGSFIAWRFFLSNTTFENKSRFLFIRTGHVTHREVLKAIMDSGFIKNPGSFEVLATKMNVWERMAPGRYEIKKGMSLFDLARLLRNRQQSPVNLVIIKLRTKEQLASLIGKKFECDSAAMIQFLNSADTLRSYGFDTTTVMTTVFPNTYTYFWNSTPSIIFKKFYAEYNKVWNDERKKLAAERRLTPTTAYILASIVEEETNDREEKGNIASVYLNRINTGMRLGADPTVKFALRDFSIKRIYEKHLAVESPYNTYRNYGLPPGPICTPTLETIDEVLNSPGTNYLYFVAKSDFSGRHVFTETYDQHLKYAKEYQEALNKEIQKRRSVEEDTGN